jgi:hypothetical protein
MSRFAVGKKALAECDVCGFRYYLRELKFLVRNEENTNLLACSECWEPDHPQNLQGKYKVIDAEAIRDPRPDFAGYGPSRENRVMPTGVKARGFIGTVTVSTP